MEGFNNQQGASNRDVEGGKGDVVATKAAAVEGVADAYKMRTRTHQETFPNTSPRWEDPSKIICRVLTMVALSRLLQGDSQATGRGGHQNQAYSNRYKIFNN